MKDDERKELEKAALAFALRILRGESNNMQEIATLPYVLNFLTEDRRE